MPSMYSEMRRRTKSSNITIFNSLILLQYVPRVFQIYRYWKELNSEGESNNKASQWFKASWNLFLYILAGHVLGAFWYFFSTQRLVACWHKACEIHGVEISFNCDHNFRKLSFLDDFCPIDTPNPSTFDFGIFLEARRSGSLESTDYLPKAFYCFWWGMRNLRCWKEAEIDNLFLPEEAAIVKAIPLSVFYRDDLLFWSYTHDGSYSVKSGYRLLMEKEDTVLSGTSNGGAYSNVWKAIWSMRIPNRVRTLVWRAGTNSLPTKVNLVRRKILKEDVCTECQTQPEDVIHALGLARS
ncbi:cyclic nucleotide-gated ion channel 1 [Quercus suber]|uniref:Cyclic nucleotide-gated ion channel 1 n=1 Tax=Quercus suber TaxID=58331 RepID=A0AAW0K9W7_QUESU